MADSSSDPGTDWAELTDHAIALLERLKETYRHSAGDAGPTEEEIRQAFSTLGAAWRRMEGSIRSAFDDEAVKAQAKRAGTALWEAITATIDYQQRADGEE